MAQLDLFSIGKKPEAIAGKKEKINSDTPEIIAVETPVVKEVLPVQQDIIEANTPVEVLEEKQQPDNNAVIFADARIRIKLKHLQKEQNTETIEAETKIKEDPIAVQDNVDVEKVKAVQKRGRKSAKEIDAEVDLIEIPEDEVLYRKQYYAISEVARWFKVNTSLLRFWEAEFDILKPRKNRKGDRMFRPEDVKNLQLIYHLLRDRKYTIEGAKEYIKGNKKKADMQLQLTQTLQKFKSFLLEMKANLQ